PRLGKHPRGRHYEGIVIHPFADRVPVIARIGIGGWLPAIGPDDAVIAVKETQYHDVLGRLGDVEGSKLPGVHIGESERITEACWVIGQQGVHLPHAWTGRQILLERFQPRRRVRQRMRDTCLVRSSSFGSVSARSTRRKQGLVLHGTTESSQADSV